MTKILKTCIQTKILLELYVKQYQCKEETFHVTDPILNIFNSLESIFEVCLKDGKYHTCALENLNSKFKNQMERFYVEK